MVKCSYSGKEIPKGQGKMYVRKDGRILYFFSNREFKFYKMNRKPVKMGWTAEARKAKQMRMAAHQHGAAEKKQAAAPKVKKDSKHDLKAAKKASKVSAKVKPAKVSKADAKGSAESAAPNAS